MSERPVDQRLPAARALIAAAVLLAAAACDGGGPPGPGPEAGDEPIVPVWTEMFGGDGYQEPLAIAAAPDGRVAVVGLFSGGLTLGASRLAGDGSVDGFLVLYGADGKPAWVRSLIGPGDDCLTAVRFVDDAVVVGGYVARQGALGDRPIDVPAEISALVARFSADGQLDWLQAFGGTGYQDARGLATTATGGLLVAGNFSDTITLDRELTSIGSTDGFVTELDRSSGAVLWSHAIASTGTERLYAIVVGQDERIMVSGSSNALTLAPGETVQPYEQVFVAGLRPGGADPWIASGVFAGGHTHVADGHSGISFEQPQLLAVGDPGQAILGATRGELFGSHGGGDLVTPALGAAVLTAIDGTGATRWRAEIIGHESLIQLAAPSGGGPVQRMVGSFSGFIKIGTHFLKSEAGRSLFVVDIGRNGNLSARPATARLNAQAGGRGVPIGFTAIGSDIAPDGSLVSAVSAVFTDGDRDVLLLRLAAPAP